MITQHQLDGYLGKSIAEICQNGYAMIYESQSAHFVSHALGYKFGVTCWMMGSGTGPGATLRIQDLLSRCRSVGAWSLRPSAVSTCLVFITRASAMNLGGKVMANVPRKHVGIYLGGFIWHYSNRRQQVVKETPTQFALHYSKPDNAMFYGSMP